MKILHQLAFWGNQFTLELKSVCVIVFLNIFFGVPYSATISFVIFVCVIASIAYIHPVYGAGVRTHNLLIMSPLPLPLDHGSLQNVL